MKKTIQRQEVQTEELGVVGQDLAVVGQVWEAEG